MDCTKQISGITISMDCFKGQFTVEKLRSISWEKSMLSGPWIFPNKPIHWPLTIWFVYNISHLGQRNHHDECLGWYFQRLPSKRDTWRYLVMNGDMILGFMTIRWYFHNKIFLMVFFLMEIPWRVSAVIKHQSLRWCPPVLGLVAPIYMGLS